MKIQGNLAEEKVPDPGLDMQQTTSFEHGLGSIG